MFTSHRLRALLPPMWGLPTCRSVKRKKSPDHMFVDWLKSKSEFLAWIRRPIFSMFAVATGGIQLKINNLFGCTYAGQKWIAWIGRLFVLPHGQYLCLRVYAWQAILSRFSESMIRLVSKFWLGWFIHIWPLLKINVKVTVIATLIACYDNGSFCKYWMFGCLYTDWDVQETAQW